MERKDKVQGEWRVNHPDLIPLFNAVKEIQSTVKSLKIVPLYDPARELKSPFDRLEISHVPRVMRGREGVGTTTNNAAEFWALNREMKAALEHGCTNVRVPGDSQFMSKQVQGEGRVNNPDLIPLYNAVMRGREGVGTITNNAAEFWALNREMKAALEHGCTNVRVPGDSQFMSKQVQGEGIVNNPDLIPLYNVVRELQSTVKNLNNAVRELESTVKSLSITPLYDPTRELKSPFDRFKISHVPRECNSEADAQANCRADSQVETMVKLK